MESDPSTSFRREGFPEEEIEQDETNSHRSVRALRTDVFISTGSRIPEGGTNVCVDCRTGQQPMQPLTNHMTTADAAHGW